MAARQCIPSKEDIDAYTNNADPNAMSMSLEDYIAARNNQVQPETRAAYHGSIDSRLRAKLVHGRPSTLVGLGSRIFLIGERALNCEFRPSTHKCHLDIAQFRRPDRLNVHGVGAGAAPCDDVADAPIAA